MNGDNPNSQINEFNGGVLGSVQTASPVTPVPPTPVAEPTSVAPVPPAPVVEPTPVAPVPPAPVVEPTPVAPVPPAPVVEPTPVAPVPPAPVVEPTPVAPVPPAPVVEPTPVAPVTPMPQPIPGTDTIPIQPGKGTNLSASQNANYLNQQKATSIGTNPPINYTNNKKKPMSKVLFAIIIVILILGVAFGVYYVLKLSKKKLEINIKNPEIMSNAELPTTLNYYATVVKGDASICNVDTSNVNMAKSGMYEVIITCGENKYISKVTVIDKTPPVLLTNIVFKKVNDDISLDEFIIGCADNETECKTSFVDEESVKDQLQTASDSQIEVEIKAEDENNNSTIAKGILYVTDVETTIYTRCSSPITNLTINNYNISKQVEDLLAIGNEGSNYFYIGYSRRVYRYIFESADDYKEATASISDNMTFDGVSGHAAFDDENNTLTISVDLEKTTLDSENGGEFPTSYVNINQLYSNKGYSCSSVRNTGPFAN